MDETLLDLLQGRFEEELKKNKTEVKNIVEVLKDLSIDNIAFRQLVARLDALSSIYEENKYILRKIKREKGGEN